MIDGKMLAELEQRKHEMAVAVGDLAGCGLSEQVEIIRNASRYLALRENEITILTAAINVFDADTYRAEYDAAADRLLENES